ncbi:hypothetical protein QBC34DRAFT_442277 [Podospora aff. communis PSN243]|uniref:Zn(2)-C6 fungal-type domain-containing protein n=1 Tax=Podospora aff. communis PSN243 TaxID=3040156 RepID=A0AAV9GB09_9PEZI|nr:hypothetical protein QBC34DRAFT_442277 [Podospora aff. communis PSN243]
MEREPGNARTRPKSRTGCVNCKRRKLKCDETLPHCTRCQKAVLKCEYHIRPIHETSPSPTPKSPSPQPSSYLLDMELMHHYSTVVCNTLSCDPEIRPVFQTLTVRAALKCDYLLKTVLAVAAVHMARSQPDKGDTYFATALDYYQTALGAANSSLANLKAENDPEEAVNLWFFSSLTIVFVLGSPPQPTTHPSNEDPLFSSTLFPDWLFLTRGTKSIRPMIPPETMSTLTSIYSARWNAMHPPAFSPSREQDALQNLETLLTQNLQNDKATLAIHLHATAVLRGIFHALSTHGPEHLDISDLFMWIHEVNDDFIPLLERPTQEALVVFAYFCVLLKRAEEWHCWLEGWGDLLMRRLRALVDGEHGAWIEWAVGEVEKGGKGVGWGVAAVGDGIQRGGGL